MPKVTIGICVKNGENTIENAIRSIIDQDYPHELMEGIFVDDGSTDRTLSIINSYIAGANMKCRVFHHQWKGLGYSRNVVVNNANGEYLIWVDADQILSRDFVRKQVEFMDNNPHVAIGKGRPEISGGTNLIVYMQNVADLVELLETDQRTTNKSLGTGACIYRVEAIRKIGGFNEKIKGAGEDLDVEHRIEMLGWLLKLTAAEFIEQRRKSWKGLWEKYYWYGAGLRKVHKSISPEVMVYRLFPLTILKTVVSRSCSGYRLTRKKVVFLFPLQWVFERTAWLLGFMLEYNHDDKQGK